VGSGGFSLCKRLRFWTNDDESTIWVASELYVSKQTEVINPLKMSRMRWNRESWMKSLSWTEVSSLLSQVVIMHSFKKHSS